MYEKEKFSNIDLNALGQGWFAFSSEEAVVGFMPRYEKQSDESLSIKVAPKIPNSNQGSSRNSRRSPLLTPSSTQPTTTNTFSKDGFPSKIEYSINGRNLAIQFFFSNDKQSADLFIDTGDYQKKIHLDETYLNRYNVYRSRVGLSSVEFDNISSDHANMVKTINKQFEDSSDSCEEDLLVHAWQCVKPQKLNENASCDQATIIDAKISSSELFSNIEFLEKGKKETSCFSRGLDYTCKNTTGTTSEQEPKQETSRIPNPSHKVSLNSLRKINLLEPETSMRKLDSLNILDESACVTGRHYNLDSRNWAINFCDKAYSEAIKGWVLG